MPRAKPFPEGEEEEKTTIESQWEDEASTTVEQGDVAEKIRALGAEPRRGNTNLTNTSAGALDEPTVDDQQAQLSAITPLRDVARMIITAGNDAGQEIEIRPGKTYTIGRAIDNDIVLTDIAVSRKHFDLRFEDGAWVIVDRGSGNGTVVNGNLEDNPFMLANGDSIEIGNTVFRFDQPNAATRAPQRTLDLDPEDEELSTVAGKPLRGEIADVLDQMPAAPMQRPQRPKTLPPPVPLRSANASQPPPLGYPPPGPMPQPSTTLPMAQMANRPPIGGPLPSLPGVSPPGAPTMLGDQLGISMHNQLPTTIPGQGAPRPLYPYPQAQANEIPPHSVHAQMLLIQTQNRRGDASTAHVPPAPYDMQMAPQRFSQPQLTKQAKLVLAGIGLAVFAAVMTVAIVKSGSKPKATVADKAKTDAKTDPKQSIAAKTTVEPIQQKALTPAAVKPTTPPSPTATTSSPPTTPPAPNATTTAATTTPPPPKATTVTTPTATPPPKATTTTPTPPPTVATTTSPPTKTVTPAPTPTKTITPLPAPKPEPVKTAKVEKKRPDRNTERRSEARRVEAAPSPSPEPVKKTGGNPDAAREEAERLYKARKFNDAANYLSNQAKKFDEDVARELRKTADFYSKLGKALATGTAPATRPTIAYEALRSAATYDRNLSNEFDSEIQSKLSQVAPKAALSYIAQKNYKDARTTLIFLRQFSSAAETVILVKAKLESAAGEIYTEATSELASNPASAKEKLKFIMTIVDSTSPWYKKATQKLSGG